MALRVLIPILLLIPLSVVPSGALAQTIPLLETALELRVIPNNPGPDETVTIRAENVFGSLGSKTFVWRVNGVAIDQGFGRDTITTTLGGIGSATVISVSIIENGVLAGEKSITLRPASLDIVWEGNTYRPPLYIGRPLPTGSSVTTLHAVPNMNQNGARVSSANLIYTWYINSSQTPYRKGFGLDTVLATSPQFENEFTVSVIAETRDGTQHAQKEVSIRPRRPEIVIYERPPLLGMRFDRAIADTVELFGDEMTFVAFPLFVNSLSEPEYVWKVDGAPVEETGRTEREVTLRKSGEGGGRFSIEFSLENAAALFERAASGFLLTF